MAGKGSLTVPAALWWFLYWYLHYPFLVRHRSSDILPSKGLRRPQNEQLLLTALFFRQLFNQPVYSQSGSHLSLECIYTLCFTTIVKYCQVSAKYCGKVILGACLRGSCLSCYDQFHDKYQSSRGRPIFPDCPVSGKLTITPFKKR